MKQHVIKIPKANRDRLFKYNWGGGKGGGWQTHGGWFLNQLDPPWRKNEARQFVNDTDFDGKHYHVKVTKEGIGKIVSDLMDHGGFADLFRKEAWPFIRDYINNPPQRERDKDEESSW